MRTSRWLLVAGTLVGLVAMHGLGGHGVHGAEPAATMAHGVASSEHMLDETTEEVASPRPIEKNSLGLDVLCVAILVGFVIAFRLRRWVCSSVGRLGRGGRACARVLPRARDPGPPSLAELSILRC
jgi:hypothetical protein